MKTLDLSAAGAMTGAAVCVRSERQKLRDKAAQIRAEIEGRATSCARSREWSLMPDDVRMCILLLAGIDGELSQLAVRNFAEFTPHEKGSIQVAIRAIHDAVTRAYALRVRAG